MRTHREIPGKTLAPAPALVAHSSRPFPQRYELVCCNLLVLFVQAIRPVHVNVGHTGCAKTKMQARIVARIIARLTEDRLRLHFSPVVHQYSGSDRAAL